MSWRISVSGDDCIASGMCAALAPEYFELETEHAEPIAPEVEPDELVLDAADSCPVQAILVRDGDREVGPRP
ncbi:ferredoxin [Amycolatopsis magusensis]|uniref:Ferredoxin n=1 Tax=Amycolatopsis magusensis TaxID=882444 RepID=A0ABS4PVZ4_9PSEU|nr:ferredoxin [Amycolatopsis magusensis]MBP2183039.1 ferredoxin [Amycolatopsis magusensis]MDI5977028.1 ferredoxin [Amycolatopsis magusensis]